MRRQTNLASSTAFAMSDQPRLDLDLDLCLPAAFDGSFNDLLFV